MFGLIAIASIVALGLLTWNLYRRFGADSLAELNDRRRPLSRMVGRGEFVDGNRHLSVALALTKSSFFYENSDMQASIDLDNVREVEYDTELGTGSSIPAGKVLRLRSNSQTFEFILPADSVAGWNSMLPPHRGETVTPAAVAG